MEILCRYCSKIIEPNEELVVFRIKRFQLSGRLRPGNFLYCAHKDCFIKSDEIAEVLTESEIKRFEGLSHIFQTSIILVIALSLILGVSEAIDGKYFNTMLAIAGGFFIAYNFYLFSRGNLYTIRKIKERWKA